jgi:hypothetical protein
MTSAQFIQESTNVKYKMLDESNNLYEINAYVFADRVVTIRTVQLLLIDGRLPLYYDRMTKSPKKMLGPLWHNNIKVS